MMCIDSHQHFWRIGDRRGQWPPMSLASIYRDFTPMDLLPAMKRCGVSGTVLVQSSPTTADTEYLLRLAQHNDFVLGVVGWVDMSSRDAADKIAALASNRLLKGLRPMLQDLPDDGWSNDEAYDVAARAMVDHKLAFDALVLPPQLIPLAAFAKRHPRLSIVIDHAGKPPIANGDLDPWREDITSLATLPNVRCKLSGLLTEAGRDADAPRLAPYVAHLFATFGPERLLWGSDWPVLQLAGEYDAWFTMARALCLAQPEVDAAALGAVFGGNARAFYQLH